VQEVPPAGLGVPLAEAGLAMPLTEAGGILEADLPQLLQLASHVLSLEATQQAQVRLGLLQPPTENGHCLFNYPLNAQPDCRMAKKWLLVDSITQLIFAFLIQLI
jgi:hypothetical protein